MSTGEPTIWPADVAAAVARVVNLGLQFDGISRPSAADMERSLAVLVSTSDRTNAYVAHTSSPAHHRDTRLQRDCVLCLGERPISTRLRPCCHSCLCEEDAAILTDRGEGCPICRTPIRGYDVGSFASTYEPL